MNFEELLKKYMAHVLEYEGITYVNSASINEKRFTPEERAYLLKLDKEVHKDW